MRIFCDSSTTEACFVPEGRKPTVIRYPQKVTVNVGEYKAVLLALEYANLGDTILTDSQLVVKQSQERWACRKAHLLPFRAEVRQLLADKYCSLGWVPREKNPAGVELEKRYRRK